MATNIYIKTFYSKLDEVKITVMEAMSFLIGKIENLSKQDQFELKLILSELLINAITHGNSLNKSKIVSLHISIDSESDILATIRDEGTGFDYITLIKKTSVKDDLLDEHGRGIMLVHSLTDKMTFNAAGNEINFYKKVNKYGQNSGS